MKYYKTKEMLIFYHPKMRGARGGPMSSRYPSEILPRGQFLIDDGEGRKVVDRGDYEGYWTRSDALTSKNISPLEMLAREAA